MSVTRYYARHLRVITVLQTITLQLRIVTRKVRNYGVITHFTHLRRNAGSVTRNSHTLVGSESEPKYFYMGQPRPWLPHLTDPLHLVHRGQCLCMLLVIIETGCYLVLLLCNLHDELVLFVRARRHRIDGHRYRVCRVHCEMLHLAHFAYTGIPLLWPVCTEYTLGPLLGGATSPPTNLWAIRREWLRAARSDTNPSHPMYAR
jgi:hypothetical protein